MPLNAAELLPSPRNTGCSTALTSSSKRSEKSAASVHDADFDNSLRYRNIYIERPAPPTELMQRAKGIMIRPRASPEIDESTAQVFRDKARRLRTENKRHIIQELAPVVIPALNEIPDQRLARNSDQVWCDAVPIPLDPDVLANPLPLPRPKPDLVFGYSETAFDHKQLMAIDVLIDQSGRSYAVPDKKIRFPFLDIEFKSQAKNGTHFIATNQVANAGSVAMNGSLEFTRRTSGEEDLDLNEPQFFSLSMDHESAFLNVHWLSTSAEDGRFSFHVEGLSKHFLDDVDGLRAVQRAVKNILDYGADDRLRTLCKALDAYRQKVILERETAASEGNHAPEVQREPQERQPQRRRPKAQLLPNRRQGTQTQPGLQVQKGAAEEDGPDESPERPPGRRAAQGKRATVKITRHRQSSIQRPERQHPTASSVKPVRASSRLAAQV